MTCSQDRRGDPCARCLAEDHPAGGTHSTVHLGTSIACVPNTGDQELVAVWTREAYFHGLRVLGLESEAFIP